MEKIDFFVVFCSKKLESRIGSIIIFKPYFLEQGTILIFTLCWMYR